MTESAHEPAPAPLEVGKNLTIAHAATLRELLLCELEARPLLEITLPEDAEIDLSFIQVMESARLSAALQDKQFSMRTPASANLMRVLERAGFTTDMTSESRAFWFHEGTIQ
ncbi:STAS domain-containing protein [Rhizobium sp. G187]|uniref:STAS domain-containing protein n=1 Tax=Rhizobium sp. G187 TaxID=3451352 RepID=UPI003EE44DD9